MMMLMYPNNILTVDFMFMSLTYTYTVTFKSSEIILNNVEILIYQRIKALKGKKSSHKSFFFIRDLKLIYFVLLQVTTTYIKTKFLFLYCEWSYGLYIGSSVLHTLEGMRMHNIVLDESVDGSMISVLLFFFWVSSTLYYLWRELVHLLYYFMIHIITLNDWCSVIRNCEASRQGNHSCWENVW